MGQRVVGDNPQLAAEERFSVEPITADQWRQLTLVLDKPDGSAIDLTLLRPVWWLTVAEARVGGTIDLDLPELGVRGARVWRYAGGLAGMALVITGVVGERRGRLARRLRLTGEIDPPPDPQPDAPRPQSRSHPTCEPRDFPATPATAPPASALWRRMRLGGLVEEPS